MKNLLSKLTKLPRKLAAVLIMAIVVSIAGLYFGIQSLSDFPKQGSIYEWCRACQVFSQANNLRQEYKTNEAVETYRQAIRIYPQDARFLVGLGLAYMDKDEYDEAITAFKQATQANPSNGDAWLRLSQVSLIAGDLQGAFDAASRAFKLVNRNPAALGQMGLTWYETGRKDLAEHVFNQTTNLGAQSPEFWLMAGKFHWRTGQMQRAEADLRQAVAMDAKNPDCWEWLGLLLSRQKKFVEAEKDLQMALKLNPNSPVKWRNLGSFYVSQKQDDKAMEPLKRAVQLRPNDVKCWRDIGRAYLRQNKFDLAEQAFQKSLALEPRDGPTCGLYVETLRKQKKYDQAEGVLRHYIMSGHKYSALLWTYLASLYEESGRPLQAAEAYNQALASDPPDNLKDYVLKRLSGQPADSSVMPESPNKSAGDISSQSGDGDKAAADKSAADKITDRPAGTVAADKAVTEKAVIQKSNQNDNLPAKSAAGEKSVNKIGSH